MNEINENEINNENLLKNQIKKYLQNYQDQLLTWHDISVKIPNPKSHILSNCSGYIKQGEFVAIIGLSGAGKSTLLNVISGRYKSSINFQINGSVKINGENINNVDMKRISSQVKQEEQIQETSTVSEAVRFSANLCSDIENKDALVDDVISSLGLINCKDTLQGGQFVKGLSGGERKRTAVAVELVGHPYILFLDEPTTGLDSYNAERMVEKMKLINSKYNNTMVFTIHQPNSEIIKLLDRVILMADSYIVQDGKVDDIGRYFEETLGQVFPPFTNHIDQILMVCNNKFYELGIARKLKIKQKYMIEQPVKNIIDCGTQFRNMILPNEDYSRMHLSSDLYYRKKDNGLYFIQEFFIVLYRQLSLEIRQPYVLKLRVFQWLIILAFVQMMQQDLSTNPTFLNQRGQFMQVVWMCTFMTMPISAFMFSKEKNIILSELSNRKYRIFDFITSKMITSFLFSGITLIEFSLAWFLVQVEEELNLAQQFKYVQVVMMGGMVNMAVGTLLGLVFSREDVLNVAAVPIIYQNLLMAGVIKDVCEMNWFMKCLAKVSHNQQMTSALQALEFDQNKHFKNMNLVGEYCLQTDFDISIWVLVGFQIGYQVLCQFVLWFTVWRGLK